jgi:cytochrome c biogenesis protein CcdA
MMPGPGGDVNTTLPLVLGILSLFCNCLFGIPALILAILSMNAKKAGNLEDARSKAKISIILAIVGMVLSVIGGVVNFIINS